jgi:CubicO group peptidase (beta-lactamase class C family)
VLVAGIAHHLPGVLNLTTKWRVVRSEMAKQHIPGLALLISRKGVPLRAEGVGRASFELNVPAKPETVFQSESIGKQFTATEVMLSHDSPMPGEHTKVCSPGQRE